MRIILSFLLIMIALAIGIIPYADGYLMKQTFMSNVEQWQAMQASQHSEIQIKVADYQLGWIKSTATIVLSDKNENGETIELPINLVIQHGPLVIINNTPTPALAFIHGNVHLPSKISELIPQTKNISLTMTSLVPLDQNLTTINYSIPAITIGSELKWDGLTGESTITKNRNVITSVKTTMVVGKISATSVNPLMGIPLTYTSDAITNEITYTRDNDKDKSSIYSLKSGKFGVSAAGSNLLTLQSFNVNSNTNVKSGMFSSKFVSQATGLQMNPMFVSPTIATIPSLQYTLSVDNLNQENIVKAVELLEHEYKYLMKGDYLKLEQSFLGIFTNKSMFNTNFALDTGNGKSSGQLQLTFNGTPKTADDLNAMIDGKLEARISKPLFNELLSLYMSIMALPTVLPPTQESEMVLRSDTGNYFQGVADLVKENVITADQSVALMALPDQIPDHATLESMVNKLDLTPAAKAAVISLYTNQYLATKAEPKSKTTISLPDQNTLVTSMIAAGELKDEGDAYSFTLEKTGQEVKVNGSTDSKAAIDFKALLSGQRPPDVAAGTFTEEPTPGEIALASVAASQESNNAFDLINKISAAADSLMHHDGSYTNSSVSADNIKALLPNHKMETPWGSAVTFTVINKTSYKVELTATPELVCKQLSSRLATNVKYTNVTPASDCKTSGTTFSCVFDSLK